MGGNLPSEADFYWSLSNPNPDDTIYFDADTSYDSDGWIVWYKWVQQQSW